MGLLDEWVWFIEDGWFVGCYLWLLIDWCGGRSGCVVVEYLFNLWEGLGKSFLLVGLLEIVKREEFRFDYWCWWLCGIVRRWVYLLVCLLCWYYFWVVNVVLFVGDD